MQGTVPAYGTRQFSRFDCRFLLQLSAQMQLEIFLFKPLLYVGLQPEWTLLLTLVKHRLHRVNPWRRQDRQDTRSPLRPLFLEPRSRKLFDHNFSEKCFGF